MIRITRSHIHGAGAAAVLLAAALLLRYTVVQPLAAPAAARPVERVLVLRDHAFAPAELVVPQGARVRLVLHNQGREAHELEIEGLPFEITDIRPGDRVTVVFTAPSLGRYELACRYPGHYERGMRGWLIVTER